jgi:hypothetical protein
MGWLDTALMTISYIQVDKTSSDFISGMWWLVDDYICSHVCLPADFLFQFSPSSFLWTVVTRCKFVVPPDLYV